MNQSLLTILTALAALTLRADAQEWIRVTSDSAGFEQSDSGQPFVPWGFNYDHREDGRLLEDYWDRDWTQVKNAFRDMKSLGANVVRIHLQFGRFMAAPATPNRESLKQLQRLVTLAEDNGLYLNLTGLGCYHRDDVPDWYNRLSESERWDAQAEFWKAVSKTCAASPAIFCYDLMNEPVVPGGNKKRTDWLGPAFAGKHFVQFIALDRASRERTEIASQWIARLVAAIREHDQRHLITVGLVPWSLDRPGLTSGFIPAAVSDQLDFLSVHIYPETGKVDEAIETLKGFAATGKPVVIEETFPLKCNAADLETFIDRSRPWADGWIGFFWGRMPDDLRPAKTIPESLTLSWLELFERKASQMKRLPQTQPTFLRNGVTAHRGCSAQHPENTMAAIRAALQIGADWVELDLLKTKDHQLVVIHDRRTGRVGDRNLSVSESTYEQLLKVDVATDFRRRNGRSLADCPPHRIPLLKDVLELMVRQEKTRVSIQPKSDCVADAVALIRSMNAQAWVGFNDGNLDYMTRARQLLPEATIFWDRGASTDLADDIRIAIDRDFDALVLHHSGITRDKVKQIRAAGLEAGAWTVNDSVALQRMLDLGVQRIYTDHPADLLELLNP